MRSSSPTRSCIACARRFACQSGKPIAGAAVPIELSLRSTCRSCGGRGEVWGDACAACEGSGHGSHRRVVTVSVPPGVAHGTRFAFSVSPPTGPRTRVEVCVAIT